MDNGMDPPESKTDLVKRLRVKAGVMEMGEKIPWGSDTALMREAAHALENMIPGIDRLEDRLQDGCELIRQESRWYLYDRNGEYVTSGDTLRDAIISVIFIDC
ncbi:MAG: hypothetical protein DIZ78_09440 [endosymbiont of Escarpia spicata]|uniref:Uncharacterized protein n=1 Tax=endosymbiont of Escarpia spicata TaxID=2200908 RepID=A0A370DN82_9GAMM|nr:MAG: hypothetical protein DIZ78_09440 [endosymbiont of Escarpia spicata]